MITPDDESAPRHTIPRWLSINDAITTGEFSSFNSKAGATAQSHLITGAHNFLDGELEKRKLAWQTSRDWYDAEELLALALVASAWSDPVVVEAAQSLTGSEVSNEAIKGFARRFLRGAIAPQQTPLPIAEAEIRLEIAKRKRLLRLNPRDALRLTETALLHANLGQIRPSENLIKRALMLSPDNRYVLRSAARFFVHSNQPDRAIAVLSKSWRTGDDPWLNAALLATEAAYGKSPSGWKRAKALLGDARFGDRDLSELAAQMGTLEAGGGARKQALRLLRRSAISPTENAVAQIAWVGTHSHIFQPEEFLGDLSLSHEASARSAYHNGAWTDALTESEAWHKIERFSPRPAILGSFVASISGSAIGRGILLAEAALVANPTNPALLNNLAVLQAYHGDITAARAALDKAILSARDLSPSLIATTGLLAFRSGNPTLGVQKYRAAIEQAVEAKNHEEAILAYCFLGREVSQCDANLAAGFVENIDLLTDRLGKNGQAPSKEVMLMRDELASIAPLSQRAGDVGLSSVDLLRALNF